MIKSKISFNSSDYLHLITFLLAFYFCSRKKRISRKKVLFNNLCYSDENFNCSNFSTSKDINRIDLTKAPFQYLTQIDSQAFIFYFFHSSKQQKSKLQQNFIQIS